MTVGTVRDGDVVGKIDELLSDDIDENLDTDENVDDYEPDLENSGDDDLEDENLDDDDDQDDDDEGDGESDNDEDEDEDESDESDIGEIESISQLAEHFDSDESTIYGLNVPMGDGLKSVTISELKDSYMSKERDQRQFSDAQQKFDQAVKAQHKQWEEQQKVPELNEQVLAAATNVRAIQQANANFDWEALEQTDPTQAILQKQKVNEALIVAKKEHQSALKILSNKRKNALDNMKAYERNKTLDIIPEWSDISTYQKDADRMGPLMESYGFTPDEVNNIYDHRLTKFVRDFMILKEQVKDADVVKKKLRKVPKKLVSSNANARKTAKKVARNKSFDNAKNSKDDRVKANAISQLLQ